MPDPTPLKIPLDRGASTTALIYPSQRESVAALILAHGAGAGQRSPFMVSFARALSERGLDVVTFNFLYTTLFGSCSTACLVICSSPARRAF